MTCQNEKILMFLKFSNESKFMPLNEGNNYILSDFFRDYADEKIILFNLHLRSQGRTYIRTFDHFPLMIKFLSSEQSPIPDSISDPSTNEIILRKQTIFNFNSILNIRIFPLSHNNSNNFFSFENANIKENNEEVKEMKIPPDVIESEPIGIEVNVNESQLNNVNSNTEKNYITEESNSKKCESQNLDLIISKADINFYIKNDFEIEKSNEIERKEEVKINENRAQSEFIINEEKTNNESNSILNSALNSALNSEIILPRKTPKIIDDDEPIESIGATRPIGVIGALKVTQSQFPNIRNSPPKENNLEIIKLTNSLHLPISETKSKVITRFTRSSLPNSEAKSEPDGIDLLNKKRRRGKVVDNIVRDVSISDLVNIGTTSTSLNEEIISIKIRCSICLDTINKTTRLDCCEHEFCKECIDQWAQFSNECPLCKEQFKKIIYWEDNQKLFKKVKKRQFKYEEEENEPWYNNCAETCMVCSKSNDEHLLLVCDKCTFNICHTYCAGLDLIPDEEWICSSCNNSTRRRTRRDDNNVNLVINNNIQLNKTENGLSRKPSKRIDDDEVNITLTRSRSKPILSKNEKNEEQKNIPSLFTSQNEDLKRRSSSSNLNLNMNLHNNKNENTPPATNSKSKSRKKHKHIHLLRHVKLNRADELRGGRRSVITGSTSEGRSKRKNGYALRKKGKDK